MSWRGAPYAMKHLHKSMMRLLRPPAEAPIHQESTVRRAGPPRNVAGSQ